MASAARPMAWVTLATTDAYALGALVLAHSLRQAETAHQLAILVTTGVSPAMRAQLAAVFDDVLVVDVLDSGDAAHLAMMARPELGVTLTKLHCWTLTQYSKAVFLDADCLVLTNCDELFEREELSAAPDIGWPDCFNSGVFVFTPSTDTFAALCHMAAEVGSFDGGDQGLLNQYFSSWATVDIRRHLPFLYNMTASASYTYLPAFRRFGRDVKIVHFLGATKPWHSPESADPGSPVGRFHCAWWEVYRGRALPAARSAAASAPDTAAAEDPPPAAAQVYSPAPPAQLASGGHALQQLSLALSGSGSDAGSSFVQVLSPSSQTDSWSLLSPAQPSELVSSLGSLPLSPEPESEPEQTVSEPAATDDTVVGAGREEEEDEEAAAAAMAAASRRRWEQGQADYTGADRFDAVWRRIEASLQRQSPPPPELPQTAPPLWAHVSLPPADTSPLHVDGAASELVSEMSRLDMPTAAESKRRAAWERGQMDFMGSDSFENILDKINKTLGEK